MGLLKSKGILPTLGNGVFIAEGAQVIGDVEVGDDSSIWFNSVVRGDVDIIRIGSKTNIQDGAILHVMRNQCPCIVGDSVTVGHGAMLHGCAVESHCLIGMRAVLLNDVVVGGGSIVAAGSVVPERTIIPPRSLVMGTPAKVQRELSDEELQSIDEYAQRYYEYKTAYLEDRASLLNQ
jgi:carbonic anhydrase/acetyltransferase-like protein (isoleucine patch superfamily)